MLKHRACSWVFDHPKNHFAFSRVKTGSVRKNDFFGVNNNENFDANSELTMARQFLITMPSKMAQELVALTKIELPLRRMASELK